jgi:VWFA-related protein
MKRFYSSRAVIALLVALCFLHIPFSAGQDIPTTPAVENASETDPAETLEPLEIKLSVNEVRLDVVVLDRRGNPITDLTAADFEVFQDNRRVAVTSSVFIDSQADAAAQSAAAQKGVPNLPASSATTLRKEDVRRTILFLVDDSAMRFEHGHNTKMALRNFAEKQMQPGDLVAIIRTDYGNNALNMFHSDRRELLARINALPTITTMEPIDDAGFISFLTANIASR